MIEQEHQEGYEPVNQLYTVKTRADGSASKWQVDTNDIRRYLDEKLKGIVRREIEYFEFEILDMKEKGTPAVSRFVARNDEEAFQKFELNCRARGVGILDFKLQATGEVEYREVMLKEKQALLPDDIVDSIFISIEIIFSHVGYLTKLTPNQILDDVYRNISSIRKKLGALAIKRDDIDPENLEIIIDTIKNMMYQVLRSAEGGWTGNRLSDITQEKIITHTGNNALYHGMMNANMVFVFFLLLFIIFMVFRNLKQRGNLG